MRKCRGHNVKADNVEHLAYIDNYNTIFPRASSSLRFQFLFVRPHENGVL